MVPLLSLMVIFWSLAFVLMYGNLSFKLPVYQYGAVVSVVTMQFTEDLLPSLSEAVMV